MNDGGSIVEFFYNLIPGSLFLFLLKYYSVFDLTIYSKDSVMILFAYIVFGLLLGFFFQGITIMLRTAPFGWNNLAFRHVQNTNYRFVEILKLFPKDEQKELKKEDGRPLFFLMDTVLRGNTSTFLPTHFSSLFALWSNLSISIITVYLIVYTRLLFNFQTTIEQYLALTSLPLLSCASLLLADKFLKSFYDTILNVYYGKQGKT